MKDTQVITADTTIDLTFAGDIAIGNVTHGRADADIYVLTESELSDVDSLESNAQRNAVMNTMYRLGPGERRVLGSNKYRVMVGIGATAFISYKGKAAKPPKSAESTTTT